MAGFFRKVAGAFVELEEGGGSRTAALDDITSGSAELLAQLEASQAQEVGTVPAPSGAPMGAPGAASAPMAGAPAASGQAGGAVMSMTAEDVFASSGLQDGANSATKALKLIAGLAMFPPEQQVVMVRAMDTADDSWAEDDVLADARARQSLLRSHLDAIANARAQELGSLQAEIKGAQDQGTSMVQDIESQIQSLQAKLAETVALTGEQIAMLNQQIQATEDSSTQAQHGITHVVNALSGLITFFSGGKAPDGK